MTLTALERGLDVVISFIIIGEIRLYLLVNLVRGHVLVSLFC